VNRRGLTLTEVAISLLIVSTTVLSAVLMLPLGLRAQLESRHQLFAAAAAMSVLDSTHQSLQIRGVDGYYNSFDGTHGRIDGSVPTAAGIQAGLVHGSARAPDLDKLLTMPDSGALPVPDVIARRLDSDGDEISTLLDQGGMLFSLAGTPVRDLGTKSQSERTTTRISPATAQRELVFAVVGAPQQNLLLSHPADDFPRYEIYPFPPAWLKQPGSYGSHARGGGRAALKVADIYKTGEITVKRNNTTVTLSGGSWPSWAADADLYAYDKKNKKWKALGQVKSRDSVTVVKLYAGSTEPFTNVDYELRSLDPAIQVSLPGVYPIATVHGTDHVGGYGTDISNGDTNRVDSGDAAFGDFANDLHNEVKPYTNYAVLQPIRYHGRNWMYFALRDASSPWANSRDAFIDLAGDAEGGWLPVQSLMGLETYYVRNKSPLDVRPTSLEAPNYPLPTYEMRASYRDRALALWQSVMPAGFTALTPRLSTANDDLRLDCDRYEFPSAELNGFTTIDPSQLAGRDFPPHPAQVMALSYLAHSAMMVAGLRPPFKNTGLLMWFDGLSGGTDSDGDGKADTFSETVDNAWYKDAKRVRYNDATHLQVTSDIYTDCVLYAGDFLWLLDDPDLVYEVATTVTITKGENIGLVELSQAYPVLGDSEGYRYGPAQAVNIPAGLDGHAHRVATNTDLAFAAAVHEMSLQWAISYARETPYDLGAPFPANRALSLDRPLVIADLFTPAGQAMRPGTNANFFSASEQHYRFITPENPQAGRYGTATGFPRGGSGSQVLTHVGVGDRRGPNHDAVVANSAFAAPSASHDRTRFWPVRPFDARDRGRELVFWSVAWQDYEDAETAPGATLDIAALGWRLEASGSGAQIITPKHWRRDSIHDQFWFMHPERRSAWADADRVRFGFVQTDSTLGESTTNLDLMLGHWGADRNNNGILDRGPVPATTRLRARSVARFTVYDAIMRVHARN
jgi:hypothetical protein